MRAFPGHDFAAESDALAGAHSSCVNWAAAILDQDILHSFHLAAVPPPGAQECIPEKGINPDRLHAPARHALSKRIQVTLLIEQPCEVRRGRGKFPQHIQGSRSIDLNPPVP